MDNVVTFPGSHRPSPKIERIEDLPPGAKAIIVRWEGHQAVARMRPAVTDRERSIRSWFPSVAEALRFARKMSIAYPTLYRLIIDETDGRAS